MSSNKKVFSADVTMEGFSAFSRYEKMQRVGPINSVPETI